MKLKESEPMILVIDDRDYDFYVDKVKIWQELNLSKEERLPVECVQNYEEAENYFSKDRLKIGSVPRLVLVDMCFPHGSNQEDDLAGYHFIMTYSELFPETEWIAMTDKVKWHTLEVKPGLKLYDAIYFNMHILDVYPKGDFSKLNTALQRFFLPKTPSDQDYFEMKVGNEAIVTKSLDLWTKIISIRLEENRPILLYGECGTGKTLFAKAFHAFSKRPGDLQIIDGEMLSENESDKVTKEKKFKDLFSINKGSIYIRNIDLVDTRLQRILIDLCNNNDNRLYGSIETPRAEYLKQNSLCQHKLFQVIVEKSIPFDVPSLKERMEDLPILVDYFIRQFNEKFGTNKSIRGREQIYQLLEEGYWPDNISGLRSVVEQTLRESVTSEVAIFEFKQAMKSRPKEKKEDRLLLKDFFFNSSEPVVITEEDLRNFEG